MRRHAFVARAAFANSTSCFQRVGTARACAHVCGRRAARGDRHQRWDAQEGQHRRSHRGPADPKDAHEATDRAASQGDHRPRRQLRHSRLDYLHIDILPRASGRTDL